MTNVVDMPKEPTISVNWPTVLYIEKFSEHGTIFHFSSGIEAALPIPFKEAQKMLNEWIYS